MLLKVYEEVSKTRRYDQKNTKKNVHEEKFLNVTR